MSFEDEVVELSLIYHGSREYIEELQAGMRDCNIKIEALQTLIKDYDAYIAETFPGTYQHGKAMQELRKRAKELLANSPSPPAC